MNRRVISLALCALLFALCVHAEAQQAGKISRVGILGSSPPSGLLALRQGLHELGWIEGRNLAIEYRSDEGHRDLLPDLAAELVQLKVDVIVAATNAALAA
jgi:putative tryptophan/tyrosine transport system substrate-binding protein